MLPSSLAVLVTGAILGGLALGAFAWAWRRGHFDDIERQAHALFDERDYRLERPWESPAEQEERRRLYGEPLAPEPGEWGGAT